MMDHHNSPIDETGMRNLKRRRKFEAINRAKSFSTIFCLICCDLIQFAMGQSTVTNVKAGILLTNGANLPYDFTLLAPALDTAYDKALRDYGVNFVPVLALYQGGCSTSNAVAETFIAANQSVDVIIGKSP